MKILDIEFLLEKKTIFAEYSFLAFAFFLILIVGLQITPGISPDPILKYLPISEKIYHEGFLWFLLNDSYETTVIPPLYEFITAFVMITGFDVIHSSRLVSLITFGLFPIPLYYISKQMYGAKFAMISVILCCVMKPFWDSGTALMTDMLFLFLVFTSIGFFSHYLKTNNISPLVFSGFFLVLANWTRWLGASLLLAYMMIFFLRIIQKKTTFREILPFFLVSVPLIGILYIRNLVLVGEVYLSEKIPFSPINILINCGMIIITIVWDFIAVSPIKNFNQILMEQYFAHYIHILPLDYLKLFESVPLSHYLPFLFGLILIIGILAIVFFRLINPLYKVISGVVKDTQIILLLFVFSLFYLGMFLFTEGTSRLTLMDSRYILPIYPILIMGCFLGTIYLINNTQQFRSVSRMVFYLCIFLFILWHSIATITYLSHVQSGRDFSDPQLMEGPAFQWMSQHGDNSSSFVINDGLRAYFWEQKIQSPLIQMPNRNYPIENYLDNLTSGSYLVITPVIGTKGPYRMIELEPFLRNSSRYSLVLSEEQDRIFKVING